MSYPKSREGGIRTKIYREYKYKLFPKISHLRGTTKLKNLLEQIAQLRMERIKKQEITAISDREWDNLIILDAARHDTYCETINPEAKSRITAESHSKGFIRENFSEGDWSDTVVITANPFYNEEEFRELTGKNPEEKFETIFQVWKTDWNEEKETVMPQKIIERTKTAEKLFPNKKKIIHFMQPHYPFIDSELENSGFGDALIEDQNEDVWTKAEQKNLSHSKVVKEYKKNHKILENHLNELKRFLKGKTIITADHGNLLGERGFYGHPGGSNLEALRKVPWDPLNE